MHKANLEIPWSNSFDYAYMYVDRIYIVQVKIEMVQGFQFHMPRLY